MRWHQGDMACRERQAGPLIGSTSGYQMAMDQFRIVVGLVVAQWRLSGLPLVLRKWPNGSLGWHQPVGSIVSRRRGPRLAKEQRDQKDG